MKTFFLYFGLSGIAAALPALFCVWLWQKDSHPVLDALSRIRRRSFAVQFFLLAFVLHLIVHGSVKTNGTGQVEGGVTNGPSGLPPLGMQTLPLLPPSSGSGFAPFGFTAGQLAAGFVLSDVGYGGSWSFDPPDGATVVSDWCLRGAADDWRPAPAFAPVSSAPAVFACGRIQDAVRAPSLVFAPLCASLGVVPEANWGLIAGPGAASTVWHGTTASNTFVVTWRDVLLNRDTNFPVSVQAEFFDDGGFVYRYDLSRASAALADPSVASNVLVGAWREGFGEGVDLASCATNPASLSSVAFSALAAEDAVVADRDGDGLSTYDEIFVHHTDPGLVDSDGDGVSDGDEVAQSLDPLSASVPNEELLARIEGFQTNMSYAAAYVAATNELVGYRLWDSFSATWPAGATNLVYERTVRIDRGSGWQQYYLSSRPDSAGGWSLGGMVLEWEDSCGESGAATASPAADSLYLPLSTNGPSFVTFRLRATSSELRSARPVYLVGYAPVVSIVGGREVSAAGGDVLTVFTKGAESSIGVSIDRSRRPCNAPLHPLECDMGVVAGVESQTGGGLRYEGGLDGGVFVASGPGVYDLPDVSVSGALQTPTLRGAMPGGCRRRLVVLMPWVRYGDHSCGGGISWDGDEYAVEYEYPLDSGCLVREWHRNSGGAWSCDCVPAAGCGLGDNNGFATVNLEYDDDTATATVSVGGEAVWSDTATHVRGDDGDGFRSEIDGGECGGCSDGCESGDCDSLEGPSLGSLRFRIPTGMPRKGQVAGFAYLMSEGPITVSPASFRYLLRGDVGASVATNGTSRTVSCACERGRALLIESVQDGARVVVRNHATGALDHTWEIVNVGGSPCEVRMRQISRLDNVMQDWTYECEQDDDTGGWIWSATDNISGIREEVEKSDCVNEGGSFSEVRAKYGADGGWLGEVETLSQVVGEGECAVLREVYRREDNGFGVAERTADYWRDTEHPARNGSLRLLQGDDIPWEYHEWDKDGFETLRVEQRNGSPAPTDFPRASSNGIENASSVQDAFLTVFSYDPLEGDDAHPDDRGKARRESRYVVRDGSATLVGRTWRRYSHVTAAGYPAVKEETWRASSAAAQFGDTSNAYSWRTVFEPVAPGGVPLVLRGETADEMDEDGVRTVSEVSASGGRVALTRRKWRGGLQFPTYGVVEMDDVHGHVLRTATCVSGGDAVIDETLSAYDDQGRLRSSSYLDGTSETNAYSCCRLLWRRDREGRRTLRSAVTGQDGLYYAMEDVWLSDVATNGFKVTQHFFDGLGRETNKVVYVGMTPGEATDFSASDGRRMSEERTLYFGAGSDAADFVDARGKVEMRRTYRHRSCDEFVTDTYADGGAQEAAMHVVRTEVRNGACATRREWDGMWTERRSWSDYDQSGCRIDYEVTESSDCGTVTNSVVRHDYLGRQVEVSRPGGTDSMSYDGSTARVLSSTSTAGDVVRTTLNVYNDFGELVGSTRDGVTSRRDETYEEISNEWWRVTRSAVSAGSATNSESEVRERLTGLSDAVRRQVVKVSADGVVTETTESYDPVEDAVAEMTVSSVGGSVVRTLRHGLAVSVETQDGTTQFEHDQLGRVVRETRGERVSETAYGAAGDVASRRTRTGEDEFAVVSYAYDAFGNRVAETNALGDVTATSYDAAGNVVEVSGAAYPVRFAYDTEGRRTLLSTTRDGTIWDVTTWEYDPATGRRLSKRYADGSQAVSSYTPDGLESVVTRPSSQWRQNTYDERRRLVGVASNDGSENAAFGYDDFDRMTCASNTASATSYLRHRGGTATNEMVSVGTNLFAIERSVDAFGRLSGRGVAGWSSQELSYTAENRVGGVSSDGATVTYAYADDGSESGCSVVLSGGAAVVRQTVHDAYQPNLVSAVTNFVNGIAVSGFDFQYDAEGRVLSRNADAFSYNARGEVTGATLGGQVDSYAYDQIGNFTSVVSGGVTNSFSANELNQYVSMDVVALSHTLDGGISTDGLRDFAYDSAGRLSSVSTGGVVVASFQYDALGRRVRKMTPEATHTYLYDGWNLILERIERDGGAADTVEYFWGKDLSGSIDGAGGVGGLLYLKHNGAVYVPLYDANGNVVQYVDAAGDIVASYAYDAFGRTLASAGSHADMFRFRFSTKYHDPESGLVYFGYRFYSPNLARWLNRDPLEEQGGLNLYAFCGNAAVDRFDPHGLASEDSAAYDKLVALMGKMGAQLFWWTVAEKYFLERENCPISAEMLKLSINGSVRNERHVFPEGGKLASAIQDSTEYKNIIDNLARNQDTGRKPYNESSKPINFDTKDLKTAVGHASYNLKGDICKTKNGRARLNLRMTVLDTYDFHMWDDAKIEANGVVLSFGNNLAYKSQQRGYLTTYPWTVSFDENRRWPW